MTDVLRGEIVEPRQAELRRAQLPADGRELAPVVDEAAELLAIGRSSLYRIIWRGEIETVHIGRSARISVEELAAFIRRRTA